MTSATISWCWARCSIGVSGGAWTQMAVSPKVGNGADGRSLRSPRAAARILSGFLMERVAAIVLDLAIAVFAFRPRESGMTLPFGSPIPQVCMAYDAAPGPSHGLL